MPHLLIAGSTGSGKSVCINAMIVSLLYKSRPEDVRFLMIDPKVVELGVYNGIPQLIVPVVTDPRKAAGALGWAVTEMLRRYQLFAANNVRDLSSYNRLAQERGYVAESGARMEHMPRIVIIIDELADLIDGRTERGGGFHLPPGADGPRRRDAPCDCDAAPERGRDHRHHQGEYPEPDCVRRVLTGGFAHHSGHGRRGKAARPGRYAVFAARRTEAGARAGLLHRRQGDRGRGGLHPRHGLLGV